MMLVTLKGLQEILSDTRERIAVIEAKPVHLRSIGEATQLRALRAERKRLLNKIAAHPDVDKQMSLWSPLPEEQSAMERDIRSILGIK
jgi:hypothetical protein